MPLKKTTKVQQSAHERFLRVVIKKAMNYRLSRENIMTLGVVVIVPMNHLAPLDDLSRDRKSAGGIGKGSKQKLPVFWRAKTAVV